MRGTLAVFALIGCSAMSAQAQQLWHSELGMQGGYTRAVRAGAGAAPTDVVSLPGFNLGPALPISTGLFVVLPWKHRVAVELDFAASQLTVGGTGTFLIFGARGDYAVTPKVYAAGGGALSYGNGVLNTDTQLGLQAAVGYRTRLSNSLRGRLEARATFWHKAEKFGPANVYSVLLGVSSETSARGVSRQSNDGWRPSIGIAGGYASVKLVGAGSLTMLAFPGFGSALTALLPAEVALPPTLFAIIPIATRIALEPAIDIKRFQESGQTQCNALLTTRLNYAVTNRWYAAAGGNLHYINASGTSAFARIGANVGWGYRFPLSGPFGGRLEMSYTMFRATDTFGLGATNTFGLMFGVTTPLN